MQIQALLFGIDIAIYIGIGKNKKPITQEDKMSTCECGLDTRNCDHDQNFIIGSFLEEPSEKFRIYVNNKRRKNLEISVENDESC
jgi:hypothetical protein